MESARFSTLAGIGLIIIIGLHYGVSCETTTQPTSVGGDSVSAPIAATPAPDGGQPGVSQSPGSDGAGTLCSRSDIDVARARTLQSIEVDGMTVRGTCYAETHLEGRLFCKVYLDERGGSRRTQKDVGEQWTLKLPDKERHKIVIDFELDLDRDGRSECQNDGTNTSVVAKIPPEPRCEKTPPPQEEGCTWNARECEWECEPVCDVETLERKAEDRCEFGYDLDIRACEYTCRPCDLEPSVSNWRFNVSSERITASLKCKNGASCSIDLYAGWDSNGRERFYHKADDSARTKCGETEEISVSYRHRGHNACLWTLTADGPGLAFDEEVVNRCRD